MTDKEELIDKLMRTLAGEYAPDLDPGLRAIMERVRERLRTQAVNDAVEAYRAGGMEALEDRWREAVDQILGQSLEAITALGRLEEPAPGGDRKGDTGAEG